MVAFAFALAVAFAISRKLTADSRERIYCPSKHHYPLGSVISPGPYLFCFDWDLLPIIRRWIIPGNSPAPRFLPSLSPNL